MIALCTLLRSHPFILRTVTFKTLKSKRTYGFISTFSTYLGGAWVVVEGNGGREVSYEAIARVLEFDSDLFERRLEKETVWVGYRERCLCRQRAGWKDPSLCLSSPWSAGTFECGGWRLRRASAYLQVGWQKRWTTRFSMPLLSLSGTSRIFRFLWIMKQVGHLGSFSVQCPPIGKELKSYLSSTFTFLGWGYSSLVEFWPII